MSEYERCSACGEFGFIKGHTCPPTWDVYCPAHGEDEDDARIFYAHSASEAAEKWAKRSDHESAEYSIARGDEEAVCRVRRVGAEEWEEYEVSGETVPRYSAYKKEVPHVK